MSKSKTVINEGFWSASNKPVPNKEPWQGQAQFLSKLRSVEEAAHVMRYRGFSVCRVCRRPNGIEEFSISSDDVTAVWPSGFSHYILAHNVEPSKAFKAFILSF